MNYNINIETYNNNTAKISSDIAPTRIYDLNCWALGAAVRNYVESEILCEE